MTKATQREMENNIVRRVVQAVMPYRIDPPETMTIAEAANYARVAERTVYSWIKDGKVAYFKMGTGKKAQVLIDKWSLYQWMYGNYQPSERQEDEFVAQWARSLGINAK